MVFGVIGQYFSVEDTIYDMLRSTDRYNSVDKTFLCTEPIWFTGIDSQVVAYEYLEGNDYQLYIEARVNDHPDAGCDECANTDTCVLDEVLFCVIASGTKETAPVIVSFQMVDSVPDHVTKVQTY